MDEKTDVIVTVIAGSCIIFLLIMVIIIFVVYYSKKITEKEADHKLKLKNRELDMLRLVIDAQESEREKIAANLHDEVGPLLSSLKLNVSKFKRDLVKNQLTEESLDQAREFIDVIVHNVRTASHHLTPQFVLKYGLEKALDNFVSSVNGVDIVIKSNLSSKESISKPITLNVYRIGLELINNCLKHDQPEMMEIELIKSQKMLLFKMTHNKKGLTNKLFNEKMNSGEGLGLESIQSRLIILNATINFTQEENQTSVVLLVPINS